MSLNKIQLIGNVGKDPDVRYLNTGVAVASFPLATTERGYTSANGTVVPERTEWHNIVIWGKNAEIVEKYVRKGDKLYLEGKIRTRSYSDKNGIQRYIVEVFVDNMEMLTPRSMVQQQNTGSNAPQPAPQQQAPAQAAPQQQQPSDNSLTDDLPF